MTNTKRNYSQDLKVAIDAYVADGNKTALQDVYRSIPSAARGTAMAASLMSAGDKMADVLDVLNNMPAAPSSRTAKRHLTDAEKEQVRDIITGALEAITNDDDDPIDPFVWEAVDAAIGRVQSWVADKMPFGDKTQHDFNVFDVVNVGDVVTGNYKGNVTSAIVNAEGGVDIGTKSFASLSAAAGSVTGGSQNGWDFWRKDGRTLKAIALGK